MDILLAYVRQSEVDLLISRIFLRLPLVLVLVLLLLLVLLGSEGDLEGDFVSGSLDVHSELSLVMLLLLLLPLDQPLDSLGRGSEFSWKPLGSLGRPNRSTESLLVDIDLGLEGLLVHVLAITSLLPLDWKTIGNVI
jgi:hypothetical protein